jgi:hypothetical protein
MGVWGKVWWPGRRVRARRVAVSNFGSAEGPGMSREASACLRAALAERGVQLVSR